MFIENNLPELIRCIGGFMTASGIVAGSMGIMAKCIKMVVTAFSFGKLEI